MKKVLFTAALLLVPAVVLAGDEIPTAMSNAEAVAGVQTNLDYVWTLVAAALVFFMQAGFAMVETGFTRAKSAVNIMMKNLMDFSMGSLFFWAIGFGLMFGSGSGWIGTDGFLFDPDGFLFDPEGSGAKADTSVSFSWAFLIFQTVFCATAATIVSGAVAGRTKFIGYLPSRLERAHDYAESRPINPCGQLENVRLGSSDSQADRQQHDLSRHTASHPLILRPPESPRTRLNTPLLAY